MHLLSVISSEKRITALGPMGRGPLLEQPERLLPCSPVVLASYFCEPLIQFLRLWRPTARRLFSLLLHNFNTGTVLHLNKHICVFRWSYVTAAKGLFDLQRGLGPQVTHFLLPAHFFCLSREVPTIISLWSSLTKLCVRFFLPSSLSFICAKRRH